MFRVAPGKRAHVRLNVRLVAGQAEHWEAMLAMSPLHQDAWFSLGYCAMKCQRPDRALQVPALPHACIACIAFVLRACNMETAICQLSTVDGTPCGAALLQ